MSSVKTKPEPARAGTRTATGAPTGRGQYDRSLSTEARRAAQRDGLLEAATAMIAAHGVATTVEHIVTRAKMSRRTFYQHFRDVADVLEHVYEQATTIALATAAAPLVGADDLIAAIRAGVAAYFEIVLAHRDVAAVVFLHYRRAGPEQEARYLRDTARYADVLRGALELAHARGLLRRAPTELAVYALVRGVEAVAMRMLDEPATSSRRAADELGDLVIAAFDGDVS